jgi:hypothetical protein
MNTIEKPGATTHSAKFDRCVFDVKAKGGANAFAVCTAQLGEEAFKSWSQMVGKVGTDSEMIKEIDEFKRTLGIGGAGPLPQSLLARQDIEGGETTEKSHDEATALGTDIYRAKMNLKNLVALIQMEGPSPEIKQAIHEAQELVAGLENRYNQISMGKSLTKAESVYELSDRLLNEAAMKFFSKPFNELTPDQKLQILQSGLRMLSNKSVTKGFTDTASVEVELAAALQNLSDMEGIGRGFGMNPNLKNAILGQRAYIQEIQAELRAREQRGDKSMNKSSMYAYGMEGEVTLLAENNYGPFETRAQVWTNVTRAMEEVYSNTREAFQEDKVRYYEDMNEATRLRSNTANLRSIVDAICETSEITKNFFVRPNSTDEADELAESFVNGNITLVRNQIAGDVHLFNAVLSSLEDMAPGSVESFRRIMTKSMNKSTLDRSFWFKEMDEWRKRGDENVYEFPGIIRELGFGGISKEEARQLFQEWANSRGVESMGKSAPSYGILNAMQSHAENFRGSTIDELIMELTSRYPMVDEEDAVSVAEQEGERRGYSSYEERWKSIEKDEGGYKCKRCGRVVAIKVPNCPQCSSSDGWIKKGQVETTGKQLERAVDEAKNDDVDTDTVVDRIKNIQLKRQKATIAERSKAMEGKSFKQTWGKLGKSEAFKKDYNGWKNRETWSIVLNVRNDYGSYMAWREASTFEQAKQIAMSSNGDNVNLSLVDWNEVRSAWQEDKA